MSGVWIKLRDIRVRVDQGDGDFWEVARALTALYEGQVVENKEDYNECELPGCYPQS